MKFMLALLIALVLDVTDWLIVGCIPIAGDLLDLIGIAVLYPLIGPYAFVGAFEFIPLIGDLAPSFLVAVFLSRTDLLKGVLGGKVEA